MGVQFTVDGKDMLSALNAVKPFIQPRNAVPVLGCVRIMSGPDGLVLTGTDMDNEITYTHEGNFPVGGFCVEFKIIYGFVKNMRWAALTFVLDDEGRLTVSSFVPCAELSAQFPTLPADHFPQSFDNAKNSLTAKGSVSLDPSHMARVRHAISREETRYYLNGAYVHQIDGKMKITSTDGHRMTVRETDVAYDGPGVIVPKKVCYWICQQKSAGDVTLSETAMSWASESIKLISKCIDGTFPDYTRVIPDIGKMHSVTFNRANLLKQLASISAIIPERSKPTKIEISDGKMHLSAGSYVTGGKVSAASSIPAEHDFNEEVVGLNANYLTDTLKSMTGENVSMWITDAASPILFVEEGITHVNMPLRV